MTNFRADLEAAFSENLDDGWVIDGSVADFGAINRKTISFWATSIEPMTEVPNGRYSLDYSLEVYVPGENPRTIDDALDEAMTEVLDVIWSHTDALLVRADRTTTNDHHTWTLTVRRGLEINLEN